MKHVHHDLIVQWANDPSIQIQWRWVGWENAEWQDGKPDWDERKVYRIKPHKHQELIDAFNQGSKIQFWSETMKEWRSARAPMWDLDIKYRIEPKTITKTYRIQYEPKNGFTEFNGKVENLRLTFEDTGERIAKLVKAEVIE